ncbi:AI-2E family transporter [Alloacidobacterium sp.]|uniref:AI-2E family transporter n=1 Tax=Alloacidobacterium sp. TaxID=2951999 RepID=UPI002D449DDB|nr:AI-2E family transporter [Alloacidobacterium sp.]HYK37689.1 AI-2E family transporter [Alloacidobacterium sp.]
MRNKRGWLNNEPMLVLGLVLLTLYFARDLLIPFAMALTLNFLLAPAVIQLERLRLRRLSAVVIVALLASAFLTVIGWVVVRQLLDVASDIPSYRQNIDHKLSQIHSPMNGPVRNAIEGIKVLNQDLSGTHAPQPSPPPEPDRTRSSARNRETTRQTGEANSANAAPAQVVVVQPPTSDFAYAQQLLKPVIKPLGMLGIVVIFTIYMLIKREDLRNRVLLLAGMSRLNVMTQALDDAARRISSYLLMNVLVNASYGLVFGVGLFLLHVPNATLWGVLLGILRMVPYAGMVIGGGLPICFALAVFPGWWTPLFALLLFVVLEIAVSNFIEPALYGSHTGISPLALVTTAMVWTLLWGLPGLILSTPLTVCLIVMGRYVPQMSFLHILLGDEAELAPEAHFYERLLAMDQTEAHHIADKFLDGHRLVDLYDGVVLPALSLAEQDRHKGFLDDTRGTFLFQSAAEMIAELTDYHSPLSDPDSEAPVERACPVVCIPASDQADEISAVMLAQLLEQRGHKSILLPAAALTSEIFERLREEPNTTICISALPPFAFVHARNLCLRVRGSLPENRILIGIWGATTESEILRERFGAGSPDDVATTLAQAIQLVRRCDVAITAGRKVEKEAGVRL